MATPTTSNCRLLMHPPRGGAWNMALDEALLETALSGGVCTLRFYRWSEPTLSLGYFQRVTERTTHEPSGHCPLVRRQTGGGAILHDQECTYSFAAPAGSPLAVDAMALYEVLHGGLIEALRGLGIRATLKPAGSVRPESPGPFLCFQRRAAGDVLWGDAKIAGSAQRRRRGALLQHGSLILRASAAAPEVPGLVDLAGGELDERELVRAWQADAARRLGLRLVAGEISNAEKSLAEKLMREKYTAAEWNAKR